MSGLPTFSAGQFAGRYRVERELGEGATAVVYLAHDTIHGREVALKVLRPELSALIGIERFLREIRVTAQLQHPNIIPVLDSGQEKGNLFCVLPYMEGGPLRKRLEREKQLPLSDVLDIGVTVARALDFAHSQNVMHRDVKPENILFAGGQPSLADFGIARAIERAVGETTTSTGIVRGTPAYMSPEQASGLDTYDGRSDIYSLACVLYEMIAGVPVFVGPTPQSIAAQRLLHNPRPLKQYRPRTPPALEAVLDKALATAPADRYQTAAAFADALEHARIAPLTPPIPWRRRLGVGLVVAAAVVAAVIVIKNGTVAEPPVVTSRPRIAVLPFDNRGQPADSVFAEGLTDEVTTRIAAMSGLAVISRRSAMQYDRSPKSIQQIGHDLGVDYILTATIRTDRRSGATGLARVSPELVRVRDDEIVWKGQQDAALTPEALFAVQSAIAERVAIELNVAILDPERASMQARPTTNFAAYEEYLAGNYYAGRWRSEEPMRRAIEAYERATKIDPKFALAFAKLSKTQSVYYADFDRSAQREGKARAALDSALRLDPKLPATRLALGFYHYWVLRNYDSAMVHLTAVRAVEPNNAELHSALGVALRSRGKWRDAVAASRQAAQLDPLSQRYAFDLATSEAWMGRYDIADREFQRAIALAPDYLPPYVSRAYNHLVWKGDRNALLSVMRDAALHFDTTSIFTMLVPRFRDFLPLLDQPWQDALARLTLRQAHVDAGAYYLAKAELFSRKADSVRARAYFDSARAVFEPRVRASPQEPFFLSELAFAYAGLGRPDEAVRAAERSVELLPASRDAIGNWALSFALARVYAMTGRYDAAIDELRRELSAGNPVSVHVLRAYPDFAPLRAQPRFQALLRDGR